MKKSRVMLQEPIPGKNAAGQKNTGYQDVIGLWAEIKPVKSDERYASQAENGSISHTLKIRYRDGVTAAMRFTRGARVFEIVGPPINLVEGNRYLICECLERF